MVDGAVAFVCRLYEGKNTLSCPVENTKLKHFIHVNDSKCVTSTGQAKTYFM
jgi:hypothetical protein